MINKEIEIITKQLKDIIASLPADGFLKFNGAVLKSDLNIIISRLNKLSNNNDNIIINYTNEDDYELDKANPTDSGVDLRASESITIPYGNTVLVGTGVRLELPLDCEAQVRPRSSFNLQGIFVPLGTIDQSYRGEIKVVISNFSTNKEDVVIEKGTKIAQLVTNELLPVSYNRTDVIDLQTSRGEGGFGSSGKF